MNTDERVLVVHLDPIGAEIDPVAVGVAGDDEAFGADVAAAVALVPFRRREGEGVHVLALEHVLQHRPVARPHRRDRLIVPAAVRR